VRADEAVRGRAYTATLRAGAAALQALASANLLELGARLVVDAAAPSDIERAPLPLVVRRVFFLTVLPWLLYLVARAVCSATIRADGSRIVVEAGWGRVDVPRAAVSAVRRWSVPVPEPGFDLVIPSGSIGLGWRAAPAVGAGPFDDAAARRRMRPLHHPAIELGLVPAAVAFVLFRLHQIIAFGGFFGEAQLYGWRRWTRTLTGVALSTFCVLLIVSTALRVAIEAIALATSRLPPPWAARVRTLLEVIGAALYYGGIAAVLLLRLGL
jgi:apolipoprotein N-acyltransferase